MVKLHPEGRFNDRGSLEFWQVGRINIHALNIIPAMQCVKSNSGYGHTHVEQKRFHRVSRFGLLKHTMQEQHPPIASTGDHRRSTAQKSVR